MTGRMTDQEALDIFDKCYMLESIDQVQSFISWIETPRPYIGIDTETSSLDWFDGKLRLVQFGDRESGWALDPRTWLGLIEWAIEKLRSSNVHFIFHNCRFDLHWIDQHTILDVTKWDWSKIHDTQNIATLVDFGIGKGLKDLAVHYVHPIANMGQTLLKSDMKKGGWGWHNVPVGLSSYWVYGVIDTILTVRLYEALWPRIAKFGMQEAYSIEQAVVEPLFHIEKNGMLLDAEWCHERIKGNHEKIEQIERTVHKDYGLENVRSGDQIAHAFVSAGIEMTAKTDKGKWKTDRDTLEEIELRTKHPLAQLVMDQRRLTKMTSSYYESFIEHQRSDGRIHPSFRQMQAATHRQSATMPAIQTVPAPRTDPDVRNSYMAREGHMYMSCDYANAEAKVFCHLSEDVTMRDAILSGQDLHAITAMKIFGLDGPAHKDSSERQISKNALFASLFGSGPQTFARTAGVPLDQAKFVLNGLYDTYKRMKPFQREVMETAQNNLDSTGRAYITLADGRRLGLGSNDDRLYSLTNFAVQGEAAVLMKRGLINASNMGLNSVLACCVHDEILVECPEESTAEIGVILQEAMEDFERYSVPLAAEPGEPAVRWADAK
jgi:DNA polymerase I-like protein with 3'-5' exonuclease and polymerase domains